MTTTPPTLTLASPAPSAPPPKAYAASIFPGAGTVLPPAFVAAVQALEVEMGVPVWLAIQDLSGNAEIDQISLELADHFVSARAEFQKGTPVALVVNSAGGYAKAGYMIASLLRKRCGGFTAVVPSYAKSAATLLVLGADRIILPEHAELGPLDAQYFDHERELDCSALDEVQALERLHSFALQAVDQEMLFFMRRAPRKISALLPDVQSFVAAMTRPLFESIDTVHYTQMSRVLRVAEEYAVRLLQPKYSEVAAKAIAKALVHNYPDHAFVIDAAEANRFGLQTETPSGNLANSLDILNKEMKNLTVIGRLIEVTP